jgi:hypothetical protein
VTLHGLNEHEKGLVALQSILSKPKHTGQEFMWNIESSQKRSYAKFNSNSTKRVKPTVESI